MSFLFISCRTSFYNPSDTLFGEIIGRIMLLKGSIKIRNYNNIKKAFPTILKMAPAQNYFGNSKQEFTKIASMGKSMFEVIPLGLELEFSTGDEQVTGMLKEDCFSEATDDLLRIYGNDLPGEWYVLGIVDSITHTPTVPKAHEFRGALDDLSNLVKLFYSQQTVQYSILPILISRELSY